MIVMVDSGKKVMWTGAVGKKGNESWVTKKAAEVLEQWGYRTRPVILFSDNEPAMLTMKRGVGGQTGGRDTVHGVPRRGFGGKRDGGARGENSRGGAEDVEERAGGEAGRGASSGVCRLAVVGALGWDTVVQICPGI